MFKISYVENYDAIYVLKENKIEEDKDKSPMYNVGIKQIIL